MSTADQQIADILAKYGEPIAGNIWRVQGQAVIYHKALERIAAQAGIAFGPPTLCCTGRGRGRTGPYPVRGQAMRTDSGRPSSSMRLSAWRPTLTSVARRRSVRACSPSPISRL